MPLYQKYRPTHLDDVLGNSETLNVLRADLAKEGRPHSYLLHGPVGCGKTTIGRIIAHELGARRSDFREIDSADFRGIDTIREIRKQSQLMALESNCRVWLLDECHKLTGDAQTALLKSLEDTPDHVYYILATTDPQKLLPTLRSRCAQYQVNPLSDSDMFRLLRHVVQGEGTNLQKPVYEQIIQDSQGLPRNALQILDQVLSVPAEQRLEVAKRQAELQSQTIELCRALINRSGWAKIASILSGLKEQDPEQIRRAVLGYCSAVLLRTDNKVAAIVMEQMIEPTYNTGFPGVVFACYSAEYEANN